jgi:hypothetical protein
VRPYDGRGARLREVMVGTFPRLCPGPDGRMYVCTEDVLFVQSSQSMQDGRLSRIMVRTCRLTDC